MSEEERQLLETMLNRLEPMSIVEGLSRDEKSACIAELSEDIQTYEEKYNGDSPIAQTNGHDADAFFDPDSLQNSFLRTVASAQLEGPADYSTNIDHYLYGLPKQDV